MSQDKPSHGILKAKGKEEDQRTLRTLRNGNRHEKNEQELDGTIKEGPGQTIVSLNSITLCIRLLSAQTQFRHYGSSSNNQLSGTRHYISTLLAMRRRLTSVDRRTLRKLLRHYEVPDKIVNIIRNSYDGLQCKVVHGGQLTDAFQLRTGIRQGCLLSPFLFLLMVDWIMKTSRSEGKQGIQWTVQNQIDDLNFADDLVLLSHTHEQMQMKTASVAAVSVSVGLSIHKEKTEVFKYDMENINAITFDGETLEDVESFTYLGSMVDEQGGSDADVKVRIGKASQLISAIQDVVHIRIYRITQ
ncbi:unnamed protein product [Schistosoma mattheei]|uniref:Uncharacterized protein n=1 Tax=Schistosoma mattheei TaxID=31246 RepID=A0A183PD49_9TREM|nr:unnamed protein product [Schistosoma mattheei]